MYVLADMRDIIHIKPWQFDEDLKTVVESELNKKYANKVVYELGLCIALFDIKKIEDSYVFPGDGSSHTRVTFRFVIWRPFIDEVLVGKHFIETFAKGRCNYPPKSLGLCKCPKEIKIFRFFSNFWIL